MLSTIVSRPPPHQAIRAEPRNRSRRLPARSRRPRSPRPCCGRVKNALGETIAAKRLRPSSAYEDGRRRNPPVDGDASRRGATSVTSAGDERRYDRAAGPTEASNPPASSSSALPWVVGGASSETGRPERSPSGPSAETARCRPGSASMPFTRASRARASTPERAWSPRRPSSAAERRPSQRPPSTRRATGEVPRSRTPSRAAMVGRTSMLCTLASSTRGFCPGALISSRMLATCGRFPSVAAR